MSSSVPTIDGDIVQKAMKQIAKSMLSPAFKGYIAVAKNAGKLKFEHFEDIEFVKFPKKAVEKKLSAFKDLTAGSESYKAFTDFVNANRIRPERPELLEVIEEANKVMISKENPLTDDAKKDMEKKLSQAMCIGCASEALEVYNALKKLSKNAVKQPHGMVANKTVLRIKLKEKNMRLINMELDGLLRNEKSLVFVGLVGQTKLELQNEICNIAFRIINQAQMETADTLDTTAPDTITMTNEQYATALGQLKKKPERSKHKVEVNGVKMFQQQILEMMKKQGGKLSREAT